MGLFDFLGGGDDEEVAEVPTYSGQIDEYIANLPKLQAATQQYAPQQAELGYQLYDQYAPQYAQTQADMYQQIYPETYGLQEMLAQQAAEGTTEGLTDAERRQFLDVQKSLVGEQSTAGIGTDYIGSNLLNYTQGRKAQNQNLGLSLLGKIPQTQNMSPNYTSYESQTSPDSALNFGLGQYALYPTGSTGAGAGGLLGSLGGMDWSSIIGGIGGMFSGNTANYGGANPTGQNVFGGGIGTNISGSGYSGVRTSGGL